MTYCWICVWSMAEQLSYAIIRGDKSISTAWGPLSVIGSSWPVASKLSTSQLTTCHSHSHTVYSDNPPCLWFLCHHIRFLLYPPKQVQNRTQWLQNTFSVLFCFITEKSSTINWKLVLVCSYGYSGQQK